MYYWLYCFFFFFSEYLNELYLKNFIGKLLLLSVVKQLFNHIWDVIKDVPNFHSEYSSVLRLLLAVKEYRYQMRKRVYCCQFFSKLYFHIHLCKVLWRVSTQTNTFSFFLREGLVVLYMKKVVTSISIKTNTQFSSKEELFRHILTFHVLLENPPGDFPGNIMDDIVGGFVEIFSNIRYGNLLGCETKGSIYHLHTYTSSCISLLFGTQKSSDHQFPWLLVTGEITKFFISFSFQTLPGTRARFHASLWNASTLT